MTDVIAIQHVHCETLGIIEEVLAGSGLRPRHVRVFDDEPVPLEMEGAAGLIVMGGPMGVYEQESYPHLRDEMRLIEGALKEERPVLGVCLGSQLLAAVLGAKVYPGPKKEIGWYEVTLDEAAAGDPVWSPVRAENGSRFTPLHWHGDQFELPRGAVRLASSEITGNQAFAHGRGAYGILFHMELSASSVAEWTEVFAEEVRDAHLDGEEIRAATGNHLPPLQRIGRSVFTRWAGLVDAGSQA